MKKYFIKSFQLIILLLIVSNGYAIDLRATNASISPDPILASSSYTISVDAVNVAGGVNPEDAVFVIIEVGGFNLTNFNAIISNTAGWSCIDDTLLSGSIACSQTFSPGTFSPGTSQSFNLTLSTGTTVVNPDTFNILITDESGLVEDFSSDNSTSVSTSGGLPPDLDFVDAASIGPYTAVEGQATPILIDYQVTNLGGDTVGGASFSLFYDDQFFTYDGGSSTVPSTWNCFGSTSSVDCFTNSLIEVTSGAFLDFQLAFLPSGFNGNAPASGSPYTFSPTLLTTNDSNSANDSITANVTITAPGAPDLAVSLIDIDGNAGLTQLDFDEGSTTAQNIHYRVVNNGVSAPNGATFTLSYDDTNFLLNGTTIPAMWSCAPPVSGQVVCTDTNLINNGGTFDFFFDFAPVMALTAGTFASLDTLLEDTNMAELPGTLIDNTTSTPVSVVSVAPQTDLEVQKFAKDVVGGTIITNIPQDTQFEYAIHVNNLSVTAGTNVVVTDNIPAGIEITSSAQSTGSWNCVIAPFVDVLTSQLVTCTHPSIAASQPNFNEIIYLDAFGRVSGPSPITNTASVTANEPDSNPSNDMDFADITIDFITPPFDVFVTKTFDSGFVMGQSGVTLEQGQQGTYKVLADTVTFGVPLKNNTVKPNGLGAVNVVLTDVLPAGITYVSHQVLGPNFSCAFNGVDTVSCTAPFLPETPAEDGVLITVLADGAIGAVVDNIASVSADPGSNADPGNDTSSAGAFTVVSAPVELDLTITKDAQLQGGSISNNNFLVGQSFEYKLVAINQNGNMAQPGDVFISDALPTGIDLDAVPTSAGWDCSFTSGTLVDCVNTVPIAANGGTLELIVPVSSQVVNTYTNTASTGIAFSSAAFEININDNSASFAVNIVNSITPTTLAVTKDALVAGATVTSVNSNSNFTYRIDVTNTGSADAINVVAVDMLPTGVNVNSTSGSGWNCTNTGPQYTCNFPGPLTPGASTFVDLNVTEATATGTQQILNNVDVSADNAPLQTATNTVNVVRPAINVILTQNPDPVEENAPFEFRVLIENTGNNNLSSVLVENLLPVGFSYQSTMKAATTNCNQNGLILACFYSTPIVPGASELLIIPIQAVGNIVPGTVYTNQTTVNALGLSNPIVKSYNFSVMPAVIPQFDVGITKSASSASVAPNSPFSYTLSVQNNGTDIVTGLNVVDNLPSGVQLASINASGWSCNGSSQVNCTLASLPAGSLSDITINVFAPSLEGVISNTAQVSIQEQDTNTSNDSSTVSVNVMNGATNGPAIADLELTKTTSSPSLISGEQYSWVIEILNHGPDVANNVVVSDLIPEGFELESVTASSGVCQNTQIDITCQIPFIFNQDTISIEVLGTAVLDSGELSSTATVTADSTDPVAGNNSGSVNVTVNPVPFFDVDLAVSIDAGDAIEQGDVSEFVINVVNNGPDNANPPELNIAVTGLLDSVTFNQGNDWSCQEASFTVTCQFNGSVIDNGQMSSVGLTVNTTQVVLDAQDVMLTATVATTETDVDSNTENNTATSVIGVSGTPTEGEIGDALRDALGSLGSTGDPILDNAIDAVSGFCEVSYFTALEGLCDSLYNAALGGDRDAVNRFLRQITPNQVIGQSTSVAEIAGAQFRNIGARLNQLRGGGGSGFSTAGLNARYGNGSIPLGMLAYLNQSEEETDGLSKIPDDFISPWGFFVNGSISMGKRDPTTKELGFDFDTYGLTAGFDYRLDAKKVIGVALGYANFDSDVDGAAKLKSKGITLTGYGSFYVNDNFYVDARISYGKPKFDQSRNINFTLGNTVIDRTAVGNTDANQYSFAMSAGYSFFKNAWNITPNASFNYVKTNIDSFTETGAGDFNVIYSEQQWDSLTWSAGLRVSKAISLKKGVITPQFDFDYNYESKNDGQDIIAHFINAPSDQIFIIETDSPDRTYGSAGLGLVYISANGKQAYINYRSVLGLQGFSRGTFNIGARFEF